MHGQLPISRSKAVGRTESASVLQGTGLGPVGRRHSVRPPPKEVLGSHCPGRLSSAREDAWEVPERVRGVAFTSAKDAGRTGKDSADWHPHHRERSAWVGDTTTMPRHLSWA